VTAIDFRKWTREKKESKFFCLIIFNGWILSQTFGLILFFWNKNYNSKPPGTVSTRGKSTQAQKIHWDTTFPPETN